VPRTADNVAGDNAPLSVDTSASDGSDLERDALQVHDVGVALCTAVLAAGYTAAKRSQEEALDAAL